jgi:DNA-binding PadR family transcriptional regulator
MSKNPSQLLRRPNDPAFLLLTSLAAGPKHGYALLKDVEEFAGVTLSPGTLYGAITRLEELGLIEPMAGVDRRRPYRITTNGTKVLREVTNEMRRLADVGAARLRLSVRGA